MGLDDLILNKVQKKLNEIVPKEESENLVQNDEVEKASYSDYSYKKVKKLREKGKYWGLDVPYLQHPVAKQEKRRPMFIVLGVLYAIALAAAVVMSVIVVINVLLPLIAQALKLNEFAKIGMWDIFGIAALFGSLMPLMAWAVVILIGGLVFAVDYFLTYQTIKMFSMSKISMQEMAKGYEVVDMLFKLGAIIVGTLAIGITILVLTRENIKPAGIALVVGVMVVICAIVGTIFGLLLSQRIKAKKEFEQLPEEQQKDFIRHNQALDRVQRRRNRKNTSIIGSSDVDF